MASTYVCETQKRKHVCVRHKNERSHLTHVIKWRVITFVFVCLKWAVCHDSFETYAAHFTRHAQLIWGMRQSDCVAEEWAKVICTTHITLGHSLNELRMSRKTGCACLKWVMAHKWAAHVSNESWHTNGLRMSQMSHGTQPNWDMSHQMTRLLILNVSSESCLTYIFGHATHTLLICNTFKLVHETHCVSYTTHSNYTLSRVFV